MLVPSCSLKIFARKAGCGSDIFCARIAQSAWNESAAMLLQPGASRKNLVSEAPASLASLRAVNAERGDCRHGRTHKGISALRACSLKSQVNPKIVNPFCW